MVKGGLLIGVILQLGATGPGAAVTGPFYAEAADWSVAGARSACQSVAGARAADHSVAGARVAQGWA